MNANKVDKTKPPTAMIKYDFEVVRKMTFWPPDDFFTSSNNKMNQAIYESTT